jgi:hypothetical protein
MSGYRAGGATNISPKCIVTITSKFSYLKSQKWISKNPKHRLVYTWKELHQWKDEKKRKTSTYSGEELEEGRDVLVGTGRHPDPESQEDIILSRKILLSQKREHAESGQGVEQGAHGWLVQNEECDRKCGKKDGLLMDLEGE